MDNVYVGCTLVGVIGTTIVGFVSTSKLSVGNRNATFLFNTLSCWAVIINIIYGETRDYPITIGTRRVNESYCTVYKHMRCTVFKKHTYCRYILFFQYSHYYEAWLDRSITNNRYGSVLRSLE